jgi:hypothetical protein
MYNFSFRASDHGSPALSSQAFLDIYIGGSNGTFLAAGSGTSSQNYVVIAGVIAGVTFVVAVVVVAIIVHMRNSDVRRRAARRLDNSSKGMSKVMTNADDGSSDNAKNLSALAASKSMRTGSVEHSKAASLLQHTGSGNGGGGGNFVGSGGQNIYGPALSVLEGGEFESQELGGITMGRTTPTAPIAEEGDRVELNQESLDVLGPVYCPFPVS